jgi:hypothetical protein
MTDLTASRYLPPKPVHQRTTVRNNAVLGHNTSLLQMFSVSDSDRQHREGVKKQGFSHEDTRRRRDEQQSILRKSKREESLQKRRKEVKPEDGPTISSSVDQKVRFRFLLAVARKKKTVQTLVIYSYR